MNKKEKITNQQFLKQSNTMKTRTIPDIIEGETYEVPFYKRENKPENQITINGVIVNPNLRDYFRYTPNNYREDEEIADWWGLPYIEINENSTPDDSYDDFKKRMQEHGYAKIDSELEYKKRIDSSKRAFLKKYPSGVCYDVYCLDGGAWDRPSWKGNSCTLEGAIQIANDLLNKDEEEYIEVSLKDLANGSYERKKNVCYIITP